jgi:energy-coupling factor transporter transmembrane protein EcfT
VTPVPAARAAPESEGALSSRRRREPELTFLRFVPGDSPVHRLWPGTKLIVAAELALAASIAPTWLTLGVIAAIVAIGVLVARIPLGAFPRFPRGFYLLIVFGFLLNALATTPRVVHLGPIPLSLGALAEAGRFFALGVVLVVSAALIGWTTRLGTVAPALTRLARPLRAVRLPVDEWIVAIALALRCLPLLIDEMRTFAAARRLRHKVADDHHSVRRAAVEVHDLVSTAIIVALRRAHDLADAISARGGIGAINEVQGSPFGWPDAVTLLGVTAIMAALLVAPSF